MPIDSDLEHARDLFINNFHASETLLANHDGFAGYWREIQVEAMETDDLGRLDRWVRDLSTDRDKVSALKAQKEAQAESDMEAQQLVMILFRLLHLLDEIYGVLIKKLNNMRGIMLNWAILAGIGAKSKPNPNLPDPDAEKKKDEKTAKEAVLAKQKTKAKPTKTKAG